MLPHEDDKPEGPDALCMPKKTRSRCLLVYGCACWTTGWGCPGGRRVSIAASVVYWICKASWAVTASSNANRRVLNGLLESPASDRRKGWLAEQSAVIEHGGDRE